MKKYLIKGSYNAEGIKGLMQEGGSGRKNAVEKMLADMGGKVESFYYAFGEDDVYVVVELPDDISAAAVGLRVNTAGLVKITTTVLLSPADVDEATKKNVSYRAPGG
ncbi:GYD domain-containing protein [Flavisolibacter tropicus]|uniref:GYD domain protein n=1 Tax=Flavisolibacter tropicus TaxID=1492898 RepID=A0A172TTW2_9BACT|nr:GYD domain-containing protein [Flavisolibacter tropicus]ANE50442.1 GYD domain protein [Flavisolibacter tropicus]